MGDAVWSWCTDGGKWMPYDDAFNDKLEAAYQAKKTELKVDDQRFVDIANMLQRRYDDRNRCRNVKRDAAPAFKKFTFILLGATKKQSQSQWIKTISDAQGLVASFIVPNKITHIICNDDQVPSHAKDLAQAQSLGIPIVNEGYLESLQTNGSKKTDVNQFLSAKNLPAAASGALATDNSPATASTASANKKPADGVGPNTKWSGLYHDAAGESIPVEAIVYYRNGNKFLAELRRPTIDLKTLIQGEINLTNVAIREGEVVSGELVDEVKVPDTYKGTLVNKVFKVASPSGANLELTFVQTVRDSQLGWLKQGSVIRGVCKVDNPVQLTVTKGTTSGDTTSFTGTLLWPTMDNAKTKIKGTKQGDKMDFEEYEVIEGDVDIPTNYSGAIKKEGQGHSATGIYYADDKKKPLGQFTFKPL